MIGVHSNWTRQKRKIRNAESNTTNERTKEIKSLKENIDEMEHKKV